MSTAQGKHACLRRLVSPHPSVEMTVAETAVIEPPAEKACNPMPEAGWNPPNTVDATRPTGRTSEVASYI
jgi:hypothetical protein